MKPTLKVFLAAIIACIAYVPVHGDEIDEKNKIIAAVKNKDIDVATNLVSKTNDVEIYAYALKTFSKSHDLNFAKVILKAALRNPSIWDDIPLDRGENNAARGATRARTIQQLALFGVKASMADLQNPSQRLEIVTQLDTIK